MSGSSSGQSTSSSGKVILHDGMTVIFSSDRTFELPDGTSANIETGSRLPEGFWSAFSIEAPGPSHAEFSFQRPGPNGSKIVFRQLRSDDSFVLAREARMEPEAHRTILDMAMSTMAQGMLVFDRTRVLAANRRLAELLKVSASLLETGMPWIMLVEAGVHREDVCESLGQRARRFVNNFDNQRSLSAERIIAGRTLQIETRYARGIGVVTYTDVTENRRREQELWSAEERARYFAEHDDLTGLLRRRAFEDRVDAMLSDETRGLDELGLINLGLDHFKSVNDLRGHAVGDFLLQSLARRFSDLLEPDDILGRVGGDEFGFAIRRKKRIDIETIAQRLKAEANRKIEVDNLEINVGASIGVAYAGDHDDPKKTKNSADIALHCAKRTARGRMLTFTPTLAEEARKRAAFEDDLALAVERGQLEMHYQVQYELRNHRAIGYEALMRWRCPKRGLVSPADFIPVAEETGLIVAMGRWALIQSTREIASLDDYSRVSVNVSPIQFALSDIVADVQAALDHSSLAPDRLEIEVTEALLLQDAEAILAFMKALDELGVAISLDDFGTGYSSLSYLTTFPFKKIKIDQSFVKDMLEDDRSNALVRSMLALAGSLDMKVTAEGVESQDQLLALAAANCDEAQGYFLGKPLAFDSLRSLVHPL